jgi:hypothetical protein
MTAQQCCGRRRELPRTRTLRCAPTKSECARHARPIRSTTRGKRLKAAGDQRSDHRPASRGGEKTLATAPIAGVPTLAGATAHPDAELLRLGEEFERHYVASLPVNAESKRLCELFDEAWERCGLSIDANFGGQLRAETAVEAAIEAEERAFNLIEAVTTKIRETPAKTFAGLAVKARALRFGAHLNTQCDLPPEDQDWPEQVMNQFVAELDRLAAVEPPQA